MSEAERENFDRWFRTFGEPVVTYGWERERTTISVPHDPGYTSWDTEFDCIAEAEQFIARRRNRDANKGGEVTYL